MIPILNDVQFDKLVGWSNAHKGASFKVTRRIDTYAAGTDDFEAMQIITNTRKGETTEGDLYIKPVFEKKTQTNNDLYSLFEQGVQDVQNHAKELVRLIKADEPGGNSGIRDVVFWATYKGESTILLFCSLLGNFDTTEPKVNECYSEGDGVSFVCDD